MTDLELAYQTLKKALENEEYHRAWAQGLQERLRDHMQPLHAWRILELVFENDAPPPPPLSLPEHAAQLLNTSEHVFRLTDAIDGIRRFVCERCGRFRTDIFQNKLTTCTGKISNLDRVLLERLLSK